MASLSVLRGRLNEFLRRVVCRKHSLDCREPSLGSGDHCRSIADGRQQPANYDQFVQHLSARVWPSDQFKFIKLQFQHVFDVVHVIAIVNVMGSGSEYSGNDQSEPNTLSIQFNGSIPFPMYLTGGDTPAPLAVPVVLIMKEGGSFAPPYGGISNLGNGFFRIAANIHDTDTPGTLCLSASAPGCKTTNLIYLIDPKDHPRDMRKTNELIERTNELLETSNERLY